MNIEDALVHIDREILSMGDDYSEAVESLCQMAEISYNYEADNFEQAKRAYKIIAERSPETIKLQIDVFFENDNFDILFSEIPSTTATTIGEHPTYVALNTVREYLSQHFDTDSLNVVDSALEKLIGLQIIPLNIGYKIGHQYFRYLNEELFGTISNDCFTVGKMMVIEDKYYYVIHKDINKLGTDHHKGFAVLFSEQNGETTARFYEFLRPNHEKPEIQYFYLGKELIVNKDMANDVANMLNFICSVESLDKKFAFESVLW